MGAIHQALVQGLDAEGLCVQFVVLDDKRCAVVRGDEFLYIGEGDHAGIEAGISLFTKMTRAEARREFVERLSRQPVAD